VKWFRRIAGYLKAARELAGAGVRLRAIVLYPIRRRLACDLRIDFRDGVSLVCPPSEPLLMLVQEIWRDRRYVTPDFQLGQRPIVIDIGAHVGTFTSWVKQHSPDARVIALEPSPRMCQFLRENVTRNGFQQVEVVEAACGATPGSARLFAATPEWGNSLHATAGCTATDEVRVMTIGEVFARFAVERCAVLKMDCESAEYDIIPSLSADLLSKIRRITLEFHPSSSNQFLTLHDVLARSGFRISVRPTEEGHGFLYAWREQRGIYGTV
jgi:FkbM family methyltransferase